MRNFRKFLALSMALLMIAGVMTGIMAKPFEDVTLENSFAEQIDILSDIGVIKGTSDTEFSPEEDVTREQMALFLFRLMLNKENAGTINGTKFEDLYDATYNGAISWATANGFIVGTSETTYEPVGGISFQDGMTMLVRALGHSSKQMDAGYPWTYIDMGIKLGLDENLEQLSYSQTLSRAELACLLYNALTAEYLIPKVSANGVAYYDKTTIIERVFNYQMEEAILTATNEFAIDGKEPVIKNGYVSFGYSDNDQKELNKQLIVSFKELGLKGTANDWLGQKIKLIFKVDTQTRLVNVLGAIEMGKSQDFNKVTVEANKKYIEVDGVRYNVVEKLSDKLQTNANELLVYFYDNSGKLTQLVNNSKVDEKLGYFTITMLYDDRTSDTASRAILKNHVFSQFIINEDGQYNIANNLKKEEITGGIINTVEAQAGDYVLYYFNKDMKRLEIIEKLPVLAKGLVTKVTANTAVVNGVEYTIGNAKAGILPATIQAQLLAGQFAQIVVKDTTILAVTNASIYDTSSKYLTATSTATPVYANGKLSYVITANIDGVNSNVFVNTSTVTPGTMYRYIKDSNDIHTLIPLTLNAENTTIETGYDKFVQPNELGFQITNATNTTITMESGKPFFTLNRGEGTGVTSVPNTWYNVNFVTDKDTVIVVKTANGYQAKKGVYGSTITVNNGATVTGAFRNEAGSVETLKYLFISDGTIGTIDMYSQYAKVLAITGRELINNQVYTNYDVFNFSTGTREIKKSLADNLQVGKTYATDVIGDLTSAVVTTTNGLVTGYTTTTISVNGETYRLAANVAIKAIKPDLTMENRKLASLYMTNVEFLAIGGEVKAIIAGSTPEFTSAFHPENGAIVVTTTSNLNGIDTNSVKLTGLTCNSLVMNLEAVTSMVTVEDNNVKNISFLMNGTDMPAGSYVATFTVNGNTYFTTFNIVK